ncbi:9342_t:CDS:2, partial [Ambispora leptoticha]
SQNNNGLLSEQLQDLVTKKSSAILEGNFVTLMPNAKNSTEGAENPSDEILSNCSETQEIVRVLSIHKDSHNEIYFKIESDDKSTSLIKRSEANLFYPQEVLAFYESKLTWN